MVAPMSCTSKSVFFHFTQFWHSHTSPSPHPPSYGPQVSDSDSDSDSDTGGTELSPPPVPFDTFAPEYIRVTPATPVLPKRDPQPSPARSPGVIPLGASPATQLLTALDLQLLHTPCDRPLPEGFSTPTGSETSVAPLRFDSDEETISMGSDSDPGGRPGPVLVCDPPQPPPPPPGFER